MKARVSYAIIVIGVILLIIGLIRYLQGKSGRFGGLISNLLIAILGFILLIAGIISLIIG